MTQKEPIEVLLLGLHLNYGEGSSFSFGSFKLELLRNLPCGEGLSAGKNEVKEKKSKHEKQRYYS